ncbi:uncharacterized protein HMPREF1541_00060 [Cyphellophora europaea CBS 101466]|uniref:GA4 desaturase n=1 Tax=Cyphellophora europaea (strain CBS 101466) TaxID=1220924 RepID=W2SDC2_CYPE1|nr:uncharacterized protein HMPREF1541_00060 [Cyphellophora europaea CBS 101466]ETN45879.1 hypothetical protein HMPREF1541_00060 [Cyphellophora europaea CBS 101466]
MSTVTTTKLDTSRSLPPTDSENGSLRVAATFNYWATASLPTINEIQAIFSGRSTDTRAVPCIVHDLRAHDLSQYNLNEHAFAVLRHSSALLPPHSATVPSFHDNELMTSAYWPELISLLKSALGVRSAVAINTTVRDIPASSPKQLNPDNPRADPKASFHPFFVVHGDYTPAGARGHMRAMLPSYFEDNSCQESTTPEEKAKFFALRQEILNAEDAAIAADGVRDQWDWSGRNYNGPRWAMLSVWRPLETVLRDPLAIMDPRTLFTGKPQAQTYAKFERMYRARPGFEPEYKSENMLPIAPSDDEEHWWYWLSEQKPDEVYTLKLFDSEAHREGSQVAECVAHSAFNLPDQDQQPLRRSAEVRVMVIW